MITRKDQNSCCFSLSSSFLACNS